MARRRRRQRGRGDELQSIATANRNLALVNRLEAAKPPLQIPGQVAQVGVGRRRRKMKGGALYDKWGAPVQAF